MDKRTVNKLLLKQKSGYVLAIALVIAAVISIVAAVSFTVVMRYINGTVDYSALRAAVYRG